MFPTGSVPSHRSCWKLLPWYVNGTLEAAEREGVEQHLEGCAACREEVAALTELRQHVRAPREAAPAAVPSLARGLEQTLAAIDAGATSRFRTSPAVRWVLAAQAAAILVLVSLLAWPGPGEPESYRTLSDPAAAAGRVEGDLRVVFRDDATEMELRRLLRSVGAEIVAGPTPVGAYTLRVGREPPAAEVLARLRADPGVRLAEPIDRR